MRYEELDALSAGYAAVLEELGLAPGDCVAFCLENHPRFLEICWAAQRSGLYYSAISSRLTASEAEYIIDDCGAKVFITDLKQAEELLNERNQTLNTLLAARDAGVQRLVFASSAAIYGEDPRRTASKETGEELLKGIVGRLEKMVNEALADAPETINQDAYEEGWIFRLRLTNPEEVDGLMDADSYAEHAESDDH